MNRIRPRVVGCDCFIRLNLKLSGRWAFRTDNFSKLNFDGSWTSYPQPRSVSQFFDPLRSSKSDDPYKICDMKLVWVLNLRARKKHNLPRVNFIFSHSIHGFGLFEMEFDAEMQIFVGYVSLDDR